METHPFAKDDELLVQSTVIEPHPQVAEVLSRATAKPLTNKARTALQKHFPTPLSLKPSHLDPAMRLLVGKQVSSHDCFLQKLQALSADSTGPLVKLHAE